MTLFVNATRRTVVARRGELCLSAWLRLRGLMFRRQFAPFDGLWLAPASAIHMFWVWFAIDCIWLDDDLKVVELTPSLRPWRIKTVGRASSVIELPPGAIDASDTQVGDQILFGDAGVLGVDLRAS